MRSVIGSAATTWVEWDPGSSPNPRGPRAQPRDPRGKREEALCAPAPLASAHGGGRGIEREDALAQPRHVFGHGEAEGDGHGMLPVRAAHLEVSASRSAMAMSSISRATRAGSLLRASPAGSARPCCIDDIEAGEGQWTKRRASSGTRPDGVDEGATLWWMRRSSAATSSGVTSSQARTMASAASGGTGRDARALSRARPRPAPRHRTGRARDAGLSAWKSRSSPP